MHIPVLTENSCADHGDHREVLPTYSSHHLEMPPNNNAAIKESIMASATREALIKSLRGKKVRVHDLDKVMSEWPSFVNPNIENLRPDVQARVTRYIPFYLSTVRLMALLMGDYQHLHRLYTGKRREKAEGVNPALFGSLWYPYAGFEELRISTHLAMWVCMSSDFLNYEFTRFEILWRLCWLVWPAQLFSWDDGLYPNPFSVRNLSTSHFSSSEAYLRKQMLETDTSALASLNKDFSAGQSFRRRTLLYVRSSLGFEISAADQQVVDQEPNVLITSFESIGQPIRKLCSLGTVTNLKSAITTDHQHRDAPATTRWNQVFLRFAG